MRLQELMYDPQVVSVAQTNGPILPGETLRVALPQMRYRGAGTVHFEAMYGMTKDVCAKIDVSADGHTRVVSGYDQTVASGSFTDPALPSMPGSLEMTCKNEMSAIGCLRQLAMEKAPADKRIRVFPGYLPSVISALEGLYGAASTQKLLIPAGSGAVRFKLVR